MPVKRMYKLICSFLPAFLLAIHVNAAAPAIDLNRASAKAREALTFCKQKGYSTKYCILIDMSLPSGVKRFMLWDFNKKEVVTSGLISHGCGSMPWSGKWSKDKPQFSNIDGSHCTALGKYRVDQRAYSAWGVHVKYYLAGLENTNNNALKREIVFHSWESVPETEVYPDGVPEGWGCPAISNNVMKVVDDLLRKQKKHTLLWVYN